MIFFFYFWSNSRQKLLLMMQYQTCTKHDKANSWEIHIQATSNTFLQQQPKALQHLTITKNTMEHENYVRLQRLLQHARSTLDKQFRARWEAIFGAEISSSSEEREAFWTNDPRGQGITNKFFPDQRQLLIGNTYDPSSGDITLLALILRSVPFKVNSDVPHIKTISAIRNKVAHGSSFHVDNSEFEGLFESLSVALCHFNPTQNGRDTIEWIKTHPVVDELTGIDDDKVREAENLKDQGNAMFGQGNFEEALYLYTEAMELPNLSKWLLGVLYSNRSLCYLKLSDNHRALQDAFRCQELQPKWYKSYLRAGQAWLAKGETQNAVKEFDLALQFEKKNQELLCLKWSATRKAIIERDPQVIVDQAGLEGRPRIPIRGQEHVEKGLAFYYGTDKVSKDVAKAIDEFKLGAAYANAEAIFNLALGLMDATTPADFHTADKLLHKAASLPPKIKNLGNCPRLGVDAAQFTLGLHFQHGIYHKRDFMEAKKWYERAISNNNGKAANNLAITYLAGDGLERNLTKAEELLLLAFRLGEYNASSNLATLYIELIQPSKVRRWLEEAKIHGQSSPELEHLCQNFLRKYGGVDEAQATRLAKLQRPLIEAIRSNRITPTSGKVAKFDTEKLEKYAAEGSSYAKKLLQSQRAYINAMDVMMTNGKVETLIHQLFLCYQFEPSGIVCQLPSPIYKATIDLLNAWISDHGSSRYPSDAEARLVLAYLTAGLQSDSEAVSILNQSIDKYPSFHAFHILRGLMHNFQGDYEAGLRDLNKAIDISPDSYELLYDRAVTIGLCEAASDNIAWKRRREEKVRQAYLDFLEKAPKDHRKVPAAYYGVAASHAAELMGNHYSKQAEKDHAAQQVEHFKRKGIEAEKDQMLFFLPYSEGSGKRVVKLYEYSKNLLQTTKKGNTAYSKNADLELSDVAKKMAEFISPTQAFQNESSSHISTHRTKLIKNHRATFSTVKKDFSDKTYEWSIPAPQQNRPRSLTGLKETFLSQLDTSRDYIAKGYVLTVTIIEPPINLTGVHFIVADENDDAERLAIYNLPGKFPSNCDQYTLGTEIAIVEPYVRQSADGFVTIRVDEPSSVMMTGRRRNKPCRYCGKEDASYNCARCNRACYCSKSCQVNDWKHLDHKRICD